MKVTIPQLIRAKQVLLVTAADLDLTASAKRLVEAYVDAGEFTPKVQNRMEALVTAARKWDSVQASLDDD